MYFMADADEMKNFIGYKKARTFPINEIEESMLPNWANSPQMAILMLNLAIVLLGLVVSLTLSDVTSGQGNSIILSFFGSC